MATNLSVIIILLWSENSSSSVSESYLTTAHKSKEAREVVKPESIIMLLVLLCSHPYLRSDEFFVVGLGQVPGC